jgi:hypothetical protein
MNQMNGLKDIMNLQKDATKKNLALKIQKKVTMQTETFLVERDAKNPKAGADRPVVATRRYVKVRANLESLAEELDAATNPESKNAINL